MHLSPTTLSQVSEMTRKIVTISRTGNKEDSPPGPRGGDGGLRTGTHQQDWHWKTTPMFLGPEWEFPGGAVTAVWPPFFPRLTNPQGVTKQEMVPWGSLSLGLASSSALVSRMQVPYRLYLLGSVCD